MDSSNSLIDKTVISTPKPRACSTERKNRITKSGEPKLLDLESKSAEVSSVEQSDFRRQCQLAVDSLERSSSSRLSALPSRYLKPTTALLDDASNFNLTAESTVSESDLLNSHLGSISAKNASTPRNSSANGRESIGRSMVELSQKLSLNPSASVDSFVEQFRKAINATTSSSAASCSESGLFRPGEEIESQLLADEMSWRRTRDVMPVPCKDISVTSNNNSDASLMKYSIGEFFQKKSDKVSDIAGTSPVRTTGPVPLIDESSLLDDSLTVQNRGRTDDATKVIDGHRSLSVTAIAKMLAETDETPRKITNYLLNSNHGNSTLKSTAKTDNVKERTYKINDISPILLLNKENQDPLCRSSPDSTSSTSPSLTCDDLKDSKQNKSITSVRSASSLSSLPNGKLPIETTKSEIVWGCVKVGKSIEQEFAIRNKSSHRLRLQCTIMNPSFKIVKDRTNSDSANIVKFILHPHEANTITVSFSPICIGAISDEINFISYDHQHVQLKKQCIRLFGYGGSDVLAINNASKDTAGRFWLSLGTLDNQETVEKSFSLKNIGTLPTFALINFLSKGIYSFNIIVKPNAFVLIPQQSQQVTITYQIAKGDSKYLHSVTQTAASVVVEMGLLKIVSGSEASRGRIRRLYTKAQQQNLIIDSLTAKLAERFDGELIPADIAKLKESCGSLKELIQHLSYKEVVVTLEQDADRTLVPQFLDDTSMFQTMCQEEITMDNSLNTTGNVANTGMDCKVEPLKIMLIPPTKLDDVIFLTSQHSKAYFDAKSVPVGLDICPKYGTISAGETVVLRVKYCEELACDRSRNFKVIIYLDNKLLEVDVKIVTIAGKSNTCY